MFSVYWRLRNGSNGCRLSAGRSLTRKSGFMFVPTQFVRDWHHRLLQCGPFNKLHGALDHLLELLFTDSHLRTGALTLYKLRILLGEGKVEHIVKIGIQT